LGGFSAQVLQQVLDDPRAAAVAALQRLTAARAGRQAVFLPLVDAGRRRATMAGVPFVRLGPFAVLAGGVYACARALKRVVRRVIEDTALDRECGRHTFTAPDFASASRARCIALRSASVAPPDAHGTPASMNIRRAK